MVETTISFLDCETTGKLDPAHRIIELSIRSHVLEDGRELKNYLQRFNPERNIDAKAVAVHGITIGELKDEPKFGEEIPIVGHILANSNILVAHNLQFDLVMLKHEFHRFKEHTGVELVFPEKMQLFDTMEKGTFATDLGKSPTLKELCWSLDVEYDPDLAHSAAYDTACLRDAFFNGYKWGWFKI